MIVQEYDGSVKRFQVLQERIWNCINFIELCVVE